MKTLAAREAKNGFGHLLDIARLEPVAIERHGRPVAVVLSSEEYARLEAFEDAYWISKAEAGAAGGYLGRDDSAALVKDIFGA